MLRAVPRSEMRDRARRLMTRDINLRQAETVKTKTSFVGGGGDASRAAAQEEEIL